MPGRPCCCNPFCSLCQTGTVPSQLQVAVSGWANDSDCTDCASIDGTHVLDWVGSTIPFTDCVGSFAIHCAYQKLHNINCGDTGDVMITVFLLGNDAVLQFCPCPLTIGGLAQLCTHVNSDANYPVTPPDCSAGNDLDGMTFTFGGGANDLVLPLTSEPFTGARCDATNVTATLTAL